MFRAVLLFTHPMLAVKFSC